ncbi:MAG: beta-lactamase family protein [Thermoanaerobaculia bacterium]|nr:beta-lactamase family protein [Thermoanaerobaculia bacterium]
MPRRHLLTVLPRIIAALALTLSMPALVCARDAPATTSTTASAATDTKARALFEGFKLPGLAVAVSHRGQIAYSGYLGHADLEHGTPVTAKTRFRIGSVSKLLTIAAVARLHQTGQLDLDAPIQRYVPYFPTKEHEFTTRQLANHTAGIRHYAAKDTQIILARWLENPPTWTSVQDSLSIFMDDPLVFEPGTAYSYSSYGYNLISAVVEGAAGKPFLEFMQEEVSRPLGLASTATDDRQAIVPHRTRFYYADPKTGEVRHEIPADNSYKWAGGGFLSSAEDLTRLASAFLTPGFLDAETLKEVFTPHPKAQDQGFEVGLGWRIEQVSGRTVYHHGGSINGGRAFVLAVPDDHLVVVLLANSYARFGKDEAMSIAESWLGAGQS